MSQVSCLPLSQASCTKEEKDGGELRAVAKAEIRKLLDAQFIKEVRYSTLLANVVMVKKANGKWQMCTDYTHLNKACLKDAYLILSIDKLVEGASGFQLLSFLMLINDFHLEQKKLLVAP